MSQLRILHIYKTYFPDSYGGVEQTIKQICLGTSKLGISNRILTLSKNPQPQVLIQPEAEIYQFPLNFEIAATGFSWQAFMGYKELSQWANVVHYHFPWPFADLFALFTVKKPTVITYHSDIVRQKGLLHLYRPLMNRHLAKADKIVVTSPNYLASSEILHKLRDKARIIPIGLDPLSYPTAVPLNLQKWQEKLGSNFFLFIGMLRYYKGLHILLEAVKNSTLQVVIVGSGPMETKLKAQAKALNLDNVHFMGSVPDVDKVALLHLCSALVFPSHLRSEAFGLTLLEGAMYEKPLITCENFTGSSYINLDKITGLVVEPNNSQQLRSAMEWMENNKDERLQMGKNAGKRFHDLFTAKKMSEGYAQLYREYV